MTDGRAGSALRDGENGASDGVALEAERLGRTPEREDVCGDAQRSDGVVNGAGELPEGVGVPGGCRAAAAVAAASSAAFPMA